MTEGNWITIDGEDYIQVARVGVDEDYPEGSHTHIQSTPAAIWVVTHNFGKRPAVTVVDEMGQEVMAEVAHQSDLNSLTVTFNDPATGEVTCIK